MASSVFADLADAFANAGATHVFTVPSIHNLGVLEAMIGAGLECVSMRSEVGAGHAADGHARLSQRPTPLVTSTGAGAGNAVGAFACAAKDGSPVVHVSTTNHRAGSHALHDVPEQRGWMAAMGRPVVDLGTMPFAAFARALASVNPFAVLLPFDGRINADAEAIEPDPMITGPPAEGALATWAGAAQPLLWIGGGARQAGTDALVGLAETFGAAVFTTSQGKDLFPADHPNFVACTLRLPELAALAADADVCLALGSRLTDVTTRGWKGPFTPSVIRVGFSSEVPPFPGTSVTTVAADANDIVEALLARAPDRPSPFGAKAGREARERRGRLEQHFIELRYLESIRAVLEPGDVLVCDMTRFAFWTLANLDLPRGVRFLWPGLLSMGFGLPAAVGASIASPDAKIVVIVGDGGIASTLSELDSLARLGHRVTVVLVDDDGYGVFRERASVTLRAQGCDFPGPKWDLVAEAYGLDYADTGSDVGAFSTVLRSERGAPMLIRLDACHFEQRAR